MTDGNRLGYVDGKLVNEIPNATYTAFRMGREWEMHRNLSIMSLPRWM